MSSAGASDSGAYWKTKRTPSSSISCGVRSISTVGGRIVIVPTGTPLPSPVSTWPFASRASAPPYMNIARRPIAVPASTFSLVASSMKPLGATIGIAAAAAGSPGNTASTPPKWSP